MTRNKKRVREDSKAITWSMRERTKDIPRAKTGTGMSFTEKAEWLKTRLSQDVK